MGRRAQTQQNTKRKRTARGFEEQGQRQGSYVAFRGPKRQFFVGVL